MKDVTIVQNVCRNSKRVTKKLIRYLEVHWTHFAHPQITLRVKAPVSIRTQFFKHKQGFVEKRLVVAMFHLFYTPMWRSKPTGGAKQGRRISLKIKQTNNYGTISCKEAIKNYNHLIKNGCTRASTFCFTTRNVYRVVLDSLLARFYKQYMKSENMLLPEKLLNPYSQFLGELTQ